MLKTPNLKLTPVYREDYREEGGGAFSVDCVVEEIIL